MVEHFPSFDEVVQRFCEDDLHLSRFELYALSGASRAEAASFAERWPMIPMEERRRVMQTLAQGAEANFEMDFDALFSCGLCDEDEEVRFHAIEGLWECEDASLVEPLVALLRDDISVEVRAAAALSLGRFALKAELEELDGDRSEAVKAALLESATNSEEDVAVCRRAIEALSYFGIKEVRGIIDAAYNHDDPRMRTSAIFAMGRSGDIFWANTILMELAAVEPEVRYGAARAAGEMQLAKAVPKLIESLGDDDREIQEAAIWALGQVGGSAARKALMQCMETCDEALKLAVDDALGELALGGEPLLMLDHESESPDGLDEEELDQDQDGWDYIDLGAEFQDDDQI